MNDSRLQSIETKIDTLIDKLHETNVILARNTESLIIHEKRTDLAERRIENLNNRIDDLKDIENEQFKDLTKYVESEFDKFNAKLEPVKNHVEVLDKTIKFIWKVIVPSVVAIFGLLYKFGIIKI